MGRSPCCDEIGVKKGPWTPEEDKKLMEYLQQHGIGSWRNLPKNAGLNRCGKSCRLRWANYLRPDIKRGKFSDEEERLIVHLHSIFGNKWSTIAGRLPGRTDNEIKNYWNTHLKKKLLRMGIDPVTHRQRTDLNLLASMPNLLAATAELGNFGLNPLDTNALLREADHAVNLARAQFFQTLMQAMAWGSYSSSSNMDAVLGVLGSSSPQNYQNGLLQLNRQVQELVDGSLASSQAPISLSNINLSCLTSNPSLPNHHLQSCPNSTNVPCEEEEKMTAQFDVPFSSAAIKLMEDDIHGASNTMLSSSSLLLPSTPPLALSSQENVATECMQDLNNSNASTPFEPWQRLDLDESYNDLSWEEILHQISSWSN